MGTPHVMVVQAGLSLVGLERHLRAKDSGMRTHALISLGAALFMIVSKFGFSDVVGNHVTLDPSRMAAQIVSGVGFIGAGLIFIRREDVHGLTSAASVWVTAALGAACGADMPGIASITVVLYLVAAVPMRFVEDRVEAKTSHRSRSGDRS